MDIDAAKYISIHNANPVKHEVTVDRHFEKSKVILPSEHRHEHSHHTPEEELDLTHKNHIPSTTIVAPRKIREIVEKEIPDAETRSTSGKILQKLAKIKKIILPVLFTAISFQEFALPFLNHDHHSAGAHIQRTAHEELGSIQNNVQEDWNIAK